MEATLSTEIGARMTDHASHAGKAPLEDYKYEYDSPNAPPPSG